MEPEDESDRESQHDGDRERQRECAQRIVEVEPEQVGLRKRDRVAQRLPRRTHRHVANDEVREFPEHEEGRDQHDRVA
jgi:hypothetical protein